MNDKSENHETEYHDQRDMDRFWAVNTGLTKEPLRQKWFLPILIVLIVISVPWYREPGESGPIVAGLPTWIWISLACAAGIGILTAIGALLFWKDSNDE